ncbi:MAG: NAD(P)-dependent oxidoreductase [Chitinispirillia bacterium]
MKNKIFVACKMNDIGIRKLKSQKDFNVVVNPRPSREDLLKHLSDANGVIIRSNVELPAEVLERAGNLKIICRGGAGVDNIDLKKATEKGIFVTNTPGLNSNSVSEQVFSYIHTLYKNIPAYDSATKSGEWKKGRYTIRELRGKILGIGGLGAIGRRVLEKAKGYHMKVKVYDPYISRTMADDLGVELVSDLLQLFKISDIVTLHMPVTQETKGKITSKVLKSMKKNAIFINTARGALLSPDAVEEALDSHDTLMAGIDVYLEEGPGHKKLAKFGDRVVMTPHISGSSVEGQEEIALLTADIVIDALTKDKLRNLVNFVKIPEELDRAYLDLAESLGQTAGSILTGEGQLEEIRITCYGDLNIHKEILIKPAVKGVLKLRHPKEVTLVNAENKTQELGIKTILREPDNSKNYGKSITVDVVVREKRKTLENSARGKLIEGEPAIIRINDYHELGIKPQGHQLFIQYDNKPGIIGCVASLLGENDINIESILARHDSIKGKKQLLVIRTQEPLSMALLDKLFQRMETQLKSKVYGVNIIQY